MAQAPPADARARKTERQMTDEEGFALLRGVMGANPSARSGIPASRRGCR
jgi:hypothetical protein